MDILEVFVDMQATGNNIKQLRKQNHYKVFDLANALGLESEQAIYKWQRGQCLPTVDNLVRLSILSLLLWRISVAEANRIKKSNKKAPWPSVYSQ